MKRFILVTMAILMIGLVGCAQLSGPIVKMSHENYIANKKMAEESLIQCSATLGFVDGLGLTDKVKFPINTAKELRAVINSPAVSLGLIELRDLCETQAGLDAKGKPYWDKQDYIRFYVLASEVRMGVQSAIDLGKLIFPDIMAKYLKFL